MLKCGLLGEKLGHSYSPQIHALLGDYEYRLYEKAPDEVASFLLQEDLDGLNVTIPYKKTVAALCDELTPAAKKLGSVNTVAFRKDASGRRKLLGDNTDYAGFKYLVKQSGMSVSGKECLVLGSGGASVTVRAVLQDLGAADVVTISRTGEDNYGNLDRNEGADILVNTTPLGMYPGNGAKAVDLERFPWLDAVYDIVYNPARTALMMQADSLRIPNFGGLAMLVAQAKAASEVFTGERIEDRVIPIITQVIGARQQNIALIGMPGCGKSSVGKILAEKTGRPFVDADAAIEKKAGCTIPEIFAKGGEEAFRKLETEVLAELGKRSGAVLATGGGCVTRPENYPLLHQNSRIVWIRRDLSLLPSDGRPISQTNDIKQIYENRKALYDRFADHIVTNDTTPEACADSILESLELQK